MYGSRIGVDGRRGARRLNLHGRWVKQGVDACLKDLHQFDGLSVGNDLWGAVDDQGVRSVVDLAEVPTSKRTFSATRYLSSRLGQKCSVHLRLSLGLVDPRLGRHDRSNRYVRILGLLSIPTD